MQTVTSAVYRYLEVTSILKIVCPIYYQTDLSTSPGILGSFKDFILPF